MDENQFQKPPYFDWSVDRWKVAIIVLLFLTLLIGTLFDSGWGRENSANTGPEMSDVASANSDASSSDGSSDGQDQAEPSSESDPEQPGGEESGSDEARSRDALPLTLASLGPNAVVSSAGIATLSGTGRTVSRIEVRDQLMLQADLDQVPIPAAEEELIGVASVDERGLWTMPLDDVLAPGQHIITIREVDNEGNILSVSSPAIVLVLDSGEQGPLSLSTPMIRFPAPAARLRAGPTVFLGSGLPGMRVRLYLDGEEVAEGMVNSREEWRLTPDEDIAPGVYVAQVEALNPQGEAISESPPVAFSVVEPVEGMAPTEPMTSPVVSLLFTTVSS